MDKIIITIVESVYLLYMFFFYKTKYSFSGASFEKQTQSIGSLFIHDTGHYENKICPFGKMMAVIAIGLAFIRLFVLLHFTESKNRCIKWTIVFDVICVILASIMNLNALVYILPLLIGEFYILF